MKAVIITGLSGAGRSRTGNWFEDQGYYCVDNMPPALIRPFIELGRSKTETIDRVAFVTDLRGKGFFKDLESTIVDIRNNLGIELQVVFVEASTATIVKRYSETRRSHPLTGGVATAEVVEAEREEMRAVRAMSDIVIDTTGLKVAQLYEELNKKILGGVTESTFSVNISSFGFKYGIPSEADMLIDVRFLENPYYVPSLKKLTGNNKKIRDYVFRSGLADAFMDNLMKTIEVAIPGYIKEGKYHLTIAFGCTGGHHRSVAMANECAKRFEAKGMRVTLNHRDLDLMAKGR